MPSFPLPCHIYLFFTKRSGWPALHYCVVKTRRIAGDSMSRWGPCSSCVERVCVMTSQTAEASKKACDTPYTACHAAVFYLARWSKTSHKPKALNTSGKRDSAMCYPLCTRVTLSAVCIRRYELCHAIPVVTPPPPPASLPSSPPLLPLSHTLLDHLRPTGKRIGIRASR